MMIRHRYQIRQQIGEGWSSYVDSAIWKTSKGAELVVIIKRLKSTVIEQDMDKIRCHLIEAMLREAIALTLCHHPQIPHFIELLWIDDSPQLVMSFIQGNTLNNDLKHHAILSWPTVRDIVLQVLDILSSVHQAGWIHCDLNPNNIIVRDKRVFLIDFGAAQQFEHPPTWDWPLGRHLYMAPEHLLGRNDIPPYKHLCFASDLHQVACLLSYLLTGQQAFRPINEEEDYAIDYLDRLGDWMLSHRNEKLQALAVERLRPDVPKGLDYILEVALDPDPCKRFLSAQEMYEAIVHVG